MAKKKKTTSGRATATRAKKKVAKKKAPRKKMPRKKAARAASSGTSGNSVDGVLKKYEKERTAQESQLSTLRKKIEELKAKTQLYQEQITKLTSQESATQDAIAQLDSRRDDEVGNLLSKLGVQLGGGGPASAADEPTTDDDYQLGAGADSEDDDADDDDADDDDADDDDADDDGDSDSDEDDESADESDTDAEDET